MSNGSKPLDVEQIARLLRYASENNLDETVRKHFRQQIDDQLNQLDQPSAGEQLSPREWEIKNCELRIRQLLSADANWSQLKALAWKRFRLTGTDLAAAQIIETVFLTGTIFETADLLAVLNEEGFDYYYHLEPRFREHLALRLMQVNKPETLRIFLLKNPLPNQQYSHIEHLFAFMERHKSKDNTASFIYYRQHATAIEEAIEKYGSSLNIDIARTFISLSRTALAAGFKDIARGLLERVQREDDHYPEALQILMDMEHDPRTCANKTCISELEKTPGWRDRLRILSAAFDQVRSHLGKECYQRPALNEVLAAPFKWFPDITTAKAELIDLIVQNIDLVSNLPNLTSVLRDHALVFVNPAGEAAIWGTVMKEMPPGHTTTDYWRAIASVHMHCINQLVDPLELWTAKKTIESIDQRSAFILPIRWADLQQAALKFISRSTFFNETERQIITNQFRLCSAEKQINLQDVAQFLRYVNTPTYELLTKLKKIVDAQGDMSLGREIILKRAEITHFTNQDLASLWKQACALNDFDYAWRVATVLAGRNALSISIKQPWQVSGECRSEYGFNPIDQSIIQQCLHGMSRTESRLISIILRIGHALPLLLSNLDPHCRQIKSPQFSAQSSEAKIEKHLNSIKFIPQMSKHFSYGFDGVLAASLQLPEFIQIMPNNSWSYLFIRLSERIGINSWLWRLSYLHARIDGLIPRALHRHKIDQAGTKIAKWMRDLSPEERSAWSDLHGLKDKLTDEEATLAIAKFVARLAICIQSDHNMALNSLRQMRTPITIIWSLERWLLSSTYSEIRNKQQTLSKVPVAINLRNANILA